MERLSSMGSDIGNLVQETVQEETTLDTLSEKEALTAEDLRGYLKEDAEGFSDEELMGAYERTGKPEGEGTTPAVTPDPAAAAPAGWDKPWRFHKADGSTVEDISKLSAKELLEHVIGFKADGSDQRRSIDEMVRLVQRIPLDEQRIAGLTRQINTQLADLQRLKESDKKATEDRALWMWALQDPTGARFQKLQEQFLQAGPPVPAGPDPAAMADNYEQQGEQFYQQHISPHLQAMARSYSLDGGQTPPHLVQHLGRELDRRFREMVDAEGAAFNDPQYAIARIRQIVQYDLPNELAAAGYRQTVTVAPAPAAAPVAPAATPNAETASLKARLANLETELARSKSRNAPGPGAGTTAGVGKGGPDLSKAKSYHDVLDMIRDPNTQWDEE